MGETLQVRPAWTRRGRHAAGGRPIGRHAAGRRLISTVARRNVGASAIVAAGTLLLPLAILSFPSAASAAPAQLLYVSTAGSTGNSCTSSADACLTIEQAVGLAEKTYADESVTIDVAAGSYAGSAQPVTVSVNEPLSIIGSSSSPTTLDDDQSGTDITVNGTSVVTIQYLTISGGDADNGGGVMTSSGSDVTLENDVVSDNEASFGGAGIDDNGSMTLTDDTITGNSAFQGGGVEVAGPTAGILTTFTDDTVSDNSAYYGAGLHNNGGASVVDDSTFYDNAGAVGGAIKNDGPTDTLDLTNDTIDDNSASRLGAGFFTAYAGVATLTDDTFTDNTAPAGDGAGFFFSDNSGTGTGTEFSNILLANNTGGDCGGLVEGAVVDGGDNVTDDSTCFGSTSPTAAGSIVTTDAALWGPSGTPPAPAANGSSGPYTVAITAASSAFEIVTNADCTVATDERDLPRPGVPGKNCDAGAYEVQQVPTTTSTVVGTDGEPWSSGPHFDGSSAEDTASVSAGGQPVSGGTVTYAFFGNDGCSSASGRPTTQTVDVGSNGSVPASETTGALSPGGYSFEASYSGAGADAPSTGACEPFEVVFASVALAKEVSSAAPAYGSDDTFTLTATNAVDASAPSGTVVVVDHLPSGLDYESSSASAGSVAESGSTVTWTIPDLYAGGSARLQIVVKVETTSAVHNKASFTEADPDADGGTTGSSNTVTVTPTYAVLGVSETVADPQPVAGAQDRFSVTVNDTGPDAADHVVVTDPLPAGVTVVSVDASQGGVTEKVVNGVETLEWDVGSLAFAASATLQITVTVDATSGSLANPVTATDSTYDPTGQTKTATASLTVAAPVTVPPTHTGEPWSGLTYWFLLVLLGIAGLGTLERARRRGL